MAIDKLNIPNSLIQKPSLNNTGSHSAPHGGELDAIASVSPSASVQQGVDIYRNVSNFSFEDGLEKAANQAVYYMNSLLNKDGLHAKIKESNGVKEVQVTDLKEQKVVNKYSLQQVVKFYADAKEAKGIIFNKAI